MTCALDDLPRTEVVEDVRAEPDLGAGARLWIGAGSRAGAIAAVLASGPSVRAIRFSARVGLLIGGALLIAGSVAVMLWNELGPGPLDVFIGAVRVRTGLSLGLAVWAVVGMMIVASWMLGRRPGPGTLIAPLIIGPAMQMSASVLDSFGRPDVFVAQLVVHLGAIFVLGVGAGALIVSRLGHGSGELLAAATARRSGQTETRVRMAIELSWLAAGVALGGPVGVGTIIVALTIGPSVVLGYRLVDGAVVRSATRSRTLVAFVTGDADGSRLGAPRVAA